MTGISGALLLMGSIPIYAQSEGTATGASGHGQPALISTSELIEFSRLSPQRRNLLELAIAVRRDHPWLHYLYGGSTPAAGGFDCSGAIYYVLGKAGLQPPRTAADLYRWVREESKLHEVSDKAKELSDPSLKHLRPGDLLFWSGTYQPTDGRTLNITHVAIYLGREKKDGRHVMINATDGRSYRGKKANGYGVYDFRLPQGTTRSRFVGYGTPPGLEATPNPIGE
jgi:hypothetical protein